MSITFGANKIPMQLTSLALQNPTFEMKRPKLLSGAHIEGVSAALISLIYSCILKVALYL